MQLETTVAATIPNWTDLGQTVLVHRPVKALLGAVVGRRVVHAMKVEAMRYWFALAVKVHEIVWMQYCLATIEESVLLDRYELEQRVSKHPPSLWVLAHVLDSLIRLTQSVLLISSGFLRMPRCMTSFFGRLKE
jgi:hypothetical protein